MPAASVIVCSCILAVAVVTSVSVDVGPLLKTLAEEQGSRYIERPMHIGRMEVRLWDGSYIIEDLRIEGLTPTAEPFLVAKRITVSNAVAHALGPPVRPEQHRDDRLADARREHRRREAQLPAVHP